MPPRLNLFTARKAILSLRASTTPASVNGPRRSIFHLQNGNPAASTTGLQQSRWNSSESDGKKGEDDSERMKGPTEDQLPHVSQEAAELDAIMSKEKRCDGIPSSPELEQGTPVSEILQRDREAQKHAPQVVKDMMNKKPDGTRSFSTSSRRPQDLQQHVAGAGNPSFDEASAALMADMISRVDHQAAELHGPEGLKFADPGPLSKAENFRTRYEPLLGQFTKLLMRDGKLTTAQKNMSVILDQLRTASPPQINTNRPLIGVPSAPQLPLNPILYLTIIVDSVAPLIKNRNQKGIVGGGASVQVPQPLAERQRRRAAIRWIIDASDKRRDSRFAHRVAQELLAVAEGRSGVWERREQVHKIGIGGRANIGKKPRT